MAVQGRTYPVVYGGWIGGVIALIVLIVVIVMWAIGQMDARQALISGALALAILLR